MHFMLFFFARNYSVFSLFKITASHLGIRVDRGVFCLIGRGKRGKNFEPVGARGVRFSPRAPRGLSSGQVFFLDGLRHRICH